jgi:hypothetical protein
MKTSIFRQRRLGIVLLVGALFTLGALLARSQDSRGLLTARVSSSELGFSSFSPRGAAGGAVIPASCESGFEHTPGECSWPPPPPPPPSPPPPPPACVPDGSCSAPSPACDQTTYGTDNCGNPCSKTGPTCPPPPPPSVDLKINGSDGPLTFEALADYTASWASTNATSCAASGVWGGSRPLSGLEGFSGVGRGTYSYALTCSGPGGQASDSAQVNVIQVPQGTFAPNPGSIILPETSTLTWSLQFADSCVIDHGIGAVNPVSGNHEVRPQQTTTYTLTCQGTDGSRSFPATVKVFSPSRREILPR